MRIAFYVAIKSHTLSIEFGKDEPRGEERPMVDTLMTPMQIATEPVGFRRIDDPLMPSTDAVTRTKAGRPDVPEP